MLSFSWERGKRETRNFSKNFLSSLSDKENNENYPFPCHCTYLDILFLSISLHDYYRSYSTGSIEFLVGLPQLRSFSNDCCRLRSFCWTLRRSLKSLLVDECLRTLFHFLLVKAAQTWLQAPLLSFTRSTFFLVTLGLQIQQQLPVCLITIVKERSCTQKVNLENCTPKKEKGIQKGRSRSKQKYGTEHMKRYSRL